MPAAPSAKRSSTSTPPVTSFRVRSTASPAPPRVVGTREEPGAGELVRLKRNGNARRSRRLSGSFSGAHGSRRPNRGLPDRSDWAYSTALMSKTQPLTRHLISINDLTNTEIETIFEVANGFLKELADPKIHYRIGRSTDVAAKSILASLFYEPSTRTRLSFESAML